MLFHWPNCTRVRVARVKDKRLPQPGDLRPEYRQPAELRLKVQAAAEVVLAARVGAAHVAARNPPGPLRLRRQPRQ